MRKITYSGAISLDGFLAGPGESIDWIRQSSESRAIMAERFRGVDAMLMGRKTFEFAKRMGGGPTMKGVTIYVLSRTMKELPEGAAGELVNRDAAEFVRQMKREKGGNILVMGGGELGSALIEADLVDEIGFSIHPILLGAGVPAFLPFRRRLELELVETRSIAPGCVMVRYHVSSPSL